MVCQCKKSWEYQTFSLIYNIYYSKYNTVWNIAFIVPNSLVSWAYKFQRNFCWHWKVKLIFQHVFPSLFLLPEWMQSPCFAWLQQKYGRDAVLGGWICTAGQPQAAQCLIILLLSLLPSSICSHHRCTGSACPAPVLLSLSLPLHPQFLPKGVKEHSRVVCNSSSQQGYRSSSRREVCPLDITCTGFCFAIYLFRGFTAVMAALYWLGLLNYCLMMITLCCLFVIPCRNGCGMCRWTLIWENSSNTNPANSGK